MLKSHFFLGNKKLRVWYFFFYVFGSPCYLLGLYILGKTVLHPSIQLREIALNFFLFGYLILGIFSLIHTFLYVQISKQLFKGLCIFLGVQIIFWMIGNYLENNYLSLFFLFLIFFVVIIYINLVALWQVQKQKETI